MAWVKVDDGFPNNAKVEPLSDRAFRLHVAGMCYSARNLTDGILSPRSVTILRAETKATNKHAAELISAGLWDVIDDGYSIHDYLEYNPTREKVLAERVKARQRMGKNRAVRTGSAADDVDYRVVFARDEGICRICGEPVEWEDAEFDHIVPISKGGAHTEANLATTHRRCNRSKRTNGAEFSLPVFGRTQERTQPRSSGVRSDLGSPSPSRPVPSHEGEGSSVSLLELQAPLYTPREGTINEHDWKRLTTAARARTSDAVGKLERTVRTRKSTTADVVCAIEAATGPGVRDPLAVALSELVKRAEARAA
jgi:hypothetical protein